jgi:hypothetical protein
MNSRPSENLAAYNLIVLLGFLIPAIFFLISQQKTLGAVRRQNRLMHPGLVWLQLIPVFNYIWQFFVIARIAGSIRKQLASRHEDTIFGEDAIVAEGAGRRPTQGIGIAYAILFTLILPLSLFQDFAGRPNDSLLLGLVSLATMVCWIIYWVQLAKYKNKLTQTK